MTHSVIYQEFFEFSAPPFSIAPNPHYLFMTQRHQDALAHLLYGLQSDGGFVLLTGEVGTGKTTICRCFLEQLPDDTDVAFIVSPCLSPKELLFAIHKDLQIKRPKNQAKGKAPTFWDSIELIYEFLLANHGKGRNTVLIIDEAQHLNAKMLELIRLLTNLETNTTKLLQVILIGQPELNETLAKPELRQLSQRITARYHIDPLHIKDTINYIWHRLKVSGNHHGRDIFPLPIIKRIHQQTSGIPRLINVLCDRALLGAYSSHEKAVTELVLKQSIKEVEGNYNLPKTDWLNRLPLHYIAVGLASCLVLVLGLLWLSPNGNNVVDTNNTELATGVIARSPQSITTLAEEKANTDGLRAVSSTIQAPYVTVQQQALSILLKRLDPNISFTIQNCQSLQVSSWRCAEASTKGVEDLLGINRPAILQLTTVKDSQRYAVVIKVVDRVAYLVDANDAQKPYLEVPLSDLEKQWPGDFTYLWQPPLGFSKNIKVGDRGPTVEWLTESFALIDGRDGFFEDKVFNQFLEARVKLFQKNHNLFADGIVGAQTILKIQEVLGVAAPLLMSTNNSIVNNTEGG